MSHPRDSLYSQWSGPGGLEVQDSMSLECVMFLLGGFVHKYVALRPRDRLSLMLCLSATAKAFRRHGPVLPTGGAHTQVDRGALRYDMLCRLQRGADCIERPCFFLRRLCVGQRVCDWLQGLAQPVLTRVLRHVTALSISAADLQDRFHINEVIGVLATLDELGKGKRSLTVYDACRAVDVERLRTLRTLDVASVSDIWQAEAHEASAYLCLMLPRSLRTLNTTTIHWMLDTDAKRGALHNLQNLSIQGTRNPLDAQLLCSLAWVGECHTLRSLVLRKRIGLPGGAEPLGWHLHCAKSPLRSLTFQWPRHKVLFMKHPGQWLMREELATFTSKLTYLRITGRADHEKVQMLLCNCSASLCTLHIEGRQAPSMVHVPAVLQHIRSNRSMSQLPGLQGFVELHTLRVKGHPLLSTIAGIQRPPNLTAIDLCNCCSLVDLAPLAQCVSLRMLHLSCVADDLTPLERCESLHTVRLCGCPHIENLQPLARCRMLRALSLRGCLGLHNLAPLVQHYGALRSLHVKNCAHIRGPSLARLVPPLVHTIRSVYILSGDQRIVHHYHWCANSAADIIQQPALLYTPHDCWSHTIAAYIGDNPREMYWNDRRFRGDLDAGHLEGIFTAGVGECAIVHRSALVHSHHGASMRRHPSRPPAWKTAIIIGFADPTHPAQAAFLYDEESWPCFFEGQTIWVHACKGRWSRRKRMVRNAPAVNVQAVYECR